MALQTTIELGRCVLSPTEEARIQRQIRSLERRLVNYAQPVATLVLDEQAQQRRCTADLRIVLGHRAATIVSHQSAETPDRAVRLAVEDIERQLERRLAQQRGEPTYGVPSRRLPEALRPHPPTSGEGGSER